MLDKKKLIFIGLNELNFDALKLYNLENFPSLQKIVYNSKVTFSEKEYDKLEPWIQWLTIYTGLGADEHNVFRLGDINKKELNNIFSDLEDEGLKVGAISPMNLNNNLSDHAFFIPDPWTKTNSDSSFFSKLISKTFSNFINNNSNNRFEIKNYFLLLLIFLRFFRLKNIILYTELIFKSRKHKFYKATFLDLLTHDIFYKMLKKNKTNFSHLFLNGIAHIQHHYLLNSKLNNSKIKNPDWYISKNEDPLFNILIYYDKIIKDYLLDNESEILIATGITQVPYDRLKFYYRLKNHDNFLKILNLKFKEVLPRMSRDFLIKFNDADAATLAEEKLSKIEDEHGEKLFGVLENRGKELFVTLTYPFEIKTQTKFKINNIEIENFQNEVSLVAIKNGMHSSKGFVYSSDNFKKYLVKDENEIDIKNINKAIISFFKK